MVPAVAAGAIFAERSEALECASLLALSLLQKG